MPHWERGLGPPWVGRAVKAPWVVVQLQLWHIMLWRKEEGDAKSRVLLWLRVQSIARAPGVAGHPH